MVMIYVLLQLAYNESNIDFDKILDIIETKLEKNLLRTIMQANICIRSLN